MPSSIAVRTVSSQALGYIRPLLARSLLTAERLVYISGHRVTMAAQTYGRLLCPLRGILIVRADGGLWLATKDHAIWLQPGLLHEIHALVITDVALISIAPTAFGNLPTTNCVVGLSAIDREIFAIRTKPEAWAALKLPEPLFRHVLGQALQGPPIKHLALPFPNDLRLRELCQMLIRTPGDQKTAGTLAGGLGVTPKTVHRLFRQHTGLTFTKWRQRVRLFFAIEHLAQGKPVHEVSKACGYASPSAFTAVFRRHFGTPPTAFIAGLIGSKAKD